MILKFIKTESVLFLSMILAIISSFIIPPDMQYLDYIDMKTICTLFSLMAVMEGFKKTGIFNKISGLLLSHAKNITALALILIYLCFGFSMFITNDVALITFVPLAMTVLNMAEKSIKEKLLVPVITIQTVAANLGSMLLPTGNPQNLYLYGISEMKLTEFIILILPFSITAFTVITIWGILQCRKVSLTAELHIPEIYETLNIKSILINIILFVLCIISVAGFLHYLAVTCIVLSVTLIADRKILKTVDYSLLLTFLCFFIFIGNIGRIDTVNHLLKTITNGHEFLTAAMASQAISNVPCAILLSGFTNNYKDLIIGVNIGGLGTLIASMASLISFKYISKENPELKKKYFIYFTVSNFILLIFFIILKIKIPCYG